MEEKEKNKNIPTKHKASCLEYFLIILLATATVACTCWLLLPIIGGSIIDLHNCFGLPEAVESPSILDFPNTVESEILITTENASRLTALESLEISLPDQEIRIPLHHPQHSYVLAFLETDYGSDGGRFLVVCPNYGWARWDVMVRNPNVVTFSPDGRFFGSLNYQGITIYDAFTFEELDFIQGREVFQLEDFAFHPTEPLIAFTTPRQVVIWNYEDSTLIAQYEVKNGGTRVSFNIEGTLLFAKSSVWGIPSE